MRTEAQGGLLGFVQAQGVGYASQSEDPSCCLWYSIVATWEQNRTKAYILRVYSEEHGFSLLLVGAIRVLKWKMVVSFLSVCLFIVETE